VSTDDPAIAAEAALYGAKVIWRPSDLAGDDASSEAGWLHAIGPARADFPGLSRLVFLQCTSPFTTAQDIECCLAMMAEQRADCALSVIPDHSFLWGFDATGFGAGMNHDAMQPRQRRQDLPPQYRENGAIYVVGLEAFERVGRRFCGKVALCPVDHPGVEIDNPADLELCARIAENGMDCAASGLACVRAVVMDFDGVHTDNLVLTDQHGVEMVRTSRGDGMGIAALREAGRWQLMILSKERNPVVQRRAEKLRIEVQHGVDDKITALEAWLADKGLTWAQLMYVGNDVNDLGAMARAAVSVCPSDAHPSVRGMADWILPAPGGKGALRVMADQLLAVKA
jgi:N-acylneuraminate cytidylyltransferase